MRKLSTIIFAIVLLFALSAEGMRAQGRLVLRTGAGDSTVTVATGQQQFLSITARTALGVIDSSYTGLKNLTFSGANTSPNPATHPTVEDNAGVAQPFGAPTTIVFVNGVASVTSNNNGVMTLYRAENPSISVTDGTISTSGTDRLLATVNPGTLGKFVWSLSSPQTNGANFTGTNFLTAQDDWGNTVTSFSALATNVTITTTLSGIVSGLGGLNTNVLNQAGDFVSGVASLTTQQMKYTGVGGVGTFTATGGGKTGISNAILIKAAPATRLVLRTAAGDSTANLTAGTAQNLRITAKDANGNIDSTYAGTKSLTFSGADPSPSPVTPPTVSNSSGTDVAFGTATSISFANGEAVANGSNNGVMRLYRTQNKIVSVTDGSLSTSGSERLTVNVSAGSLGKFAWALVTPQTSGVAFTGLDTLTAQDDYGNTSTSMDASVTPVTITSSLGGSITGLGSGGNNILNRSSDFSSGVAVLNGKLVFTGASGTGTFTAVTGGGKNGTSVGIVINAGTAVRLVVRTSLGDSVISLAAGVAQGLKITARDASGNIATGYTGAKALNFFGASVSPAPDSKNPTVSDNAGTLRNFSASQNTSITFTSGVATISGANNGIMRLYKVETALIGASDGTITTASNDLLNSTVSPGGLGRFNMVITSPQVNGSAFTGVNTVTAIDSFGNVATNFSAASNNVTVAASGLTGTISGLGSGNTNVLNQSGDFVLGIANVTGKMKYTGTVGSGTFSATSAIREDRHIGQRDDQRRCGIAPCHYRQCEPAGRIRTEPDDYGQGQLGEHCDQLYRRQEPSVQRFESVDEPGDLPDRFRQGWVCPTIRRTFLRDLQQRPGNGVWYVQRRFAPLSCRQRHDCGE